jgi:ribosomal protein S18 acetylase RimI-like enzyme
VPDDQAVSALDGLPTGWTAVTPGGGDTAELHALLHRHELEGRGSSSASRVEVDTDVTGTGGRTRRHLLVRDGSTRARGWATVHDRAAGRVLVSVVVDPSADESSADTVAGFLFAWATREAADLALDRRLDGTQLDCGAFSGDERQQRWLSRAGFDLTRTWWQMRRPVTPQEAAPGSLPAPGAGVVVRRVREAEDGMPEHADLVAVHDVLEASFNDHFNYHEESFDEFVSRLREDPGHRWDHWWLAELTDTAGTDSPQPVGALVGTVVHGPDDAPDGSYVAYLGVLQSARGRGAARSLLHAVIADAAQRGRDHVGLEVDADSPTGAVTLYTSMGFVTSYVTQSWHRDLPVGG